MPFELNHISYHYADRKVIDDISLSIGSGKLYGIIGPNGSGKTTLLDLMARHRLPETAGNGQPGSSSAPAGRRIRPNQP